MRSTWSRPSANNRQLLSALLLLVGSGLALTVLQRGLLLAVAEHPTAGASPILGFDFPAWILWLPLAPVIVFVARRWDFRGSAVRSVAAHVTVAAVIAAVHTGALVGILRLSAERTTPFAVETGRLLSWRLAVDAFVYAAIVATTLAMDAAARARARERVAARAEGESTRARLHALQMQIQPHFLFNTLNTAAMMARSGDALGAAEVITRLSELLRDVVTESPEARVAFREEIAFVERYVAIERHRFGERLRVTITTTADALDVAVPRFLLQPLVENAIRHGLSRSPTSGRVEVGATVERGWLSITVADDGPGPTPGTAGDGLGLANTRSRLATLYGEAFELTLAPSHPGAVVTMRFPASLTTLA